MAQVRLLTTGLRLHLTCRRSSQDSAINAHVLYCARMGGLVARAWCHSFTNMKPICASCGLPINPEDREDFQHQPLHWKCAFAYSALAMKKNGMQIRPSILKRLMSWLRHQV